MRTLEVNAEYFGVSRLLLMENAGHCVACQIASRFKPGKSIAIFCGLGGNGGDGFVVARHLSSLGFKPTIFLAGKAEEISDKAAVENWKAVEFLKGTIDVKEVYDSSLVTEVDAEVIVDALLGTGTRGKLKPPILQLVKKINSTRAFRVAVDVPTGIDAVLWSKKMEDLGAGEILLTSMDRDGTKIGYDIPLTRIFSDFLNIPVIASGGAGTLEHLQEAFLWGRADAVLAASIFHYRQHTIRQAKDFLRQRGIPIREG